MLIGYDEWELIIFKFRPKQIFLLFLNIADRVLFYSQATTIKQNVKEFSSAKTSAHRQMDRNRIERARNLKQLSTQLVAKIVLER